MNMYKVDSIGATNKLSKATECSKHALAKIINKGRGAYYQDRIKAHNLGG